MAPYKNDYTKHEDAMMWELHELRQQLAKQNKNSSQIHAAAKKVIEQFGLSNLRVVENR